MLNFGGVLVLLSLQFDFLDSQAHVDFISAKVAV